MSSIQGPNRVRIDGQSGCTGWVDYFVDGCLLYAEAAGPFNKELLQSAMDAQAPLFAELSKRGPWGQVLTFLNSILAGPDVTAFFISQLQLTSQRGIAPVATAIVIPEGLQGACVLAPKLADAYAAAGRTFKIFSSQEEAANWVAGVVSPPKGL